MDAAQRLLAAWPCPKVQLTKSMREDDTTNKKTTLVSFLSYSAR